MCQRRFVIGEDLDLNWLGRIRQIANHVLQHLRKLDIEFRLGGLDLCTHIFHHIINSAAPLRFELHREVAGIGLRHGSQTHLQTGAARCDLNLGRVVQNSLDMLQARDSSQ